MTPTPPPINPEGTGAANNRPGTPALFNTWLTGAAWPLIGARRRSVEAWKWPRPEN